MGCTKFFLALWVAVGGDVEWRHTMIEPWGAADMIRGPFGSVETCRDRRVGYESECFALVTRCMEAGYRNPSRDSR